MATDNVATIRYLIEEVWNKGNIKALSEIASPELASHDPLMGDRSGLEAAQQFVQAFRTAFPDFELTINDIGAVADKVFVRWTATGTHRGSLLGIAPSNMRGVNEGITINRFEKGKLVEVWYAWDKYAMLQQMGLLPALDQLARSPAQEVAPVAK